MSVFVSGVPFGEAIESNVVRTLLPTELRTKDLAKLEPELLARSRFSAGVAEAGFLQEIDDVVGAASRGEINRAQGRERLKEFLGSLGDETVDNTDLTDVRSDARLNLVIDTNVAQAFGRGQYVQGLSAGVLDQWPARELVRVRDAAKPRNWAKIWSDAIDRLGARTKAIFWGSRMVAPVGDPIWVEISRFRQPYAPFDFGSGMDTDDIARDEAEEMELIGPDEEATAPEVDSFNADLQATPAVRADWLSNALSTALQGFAKFDAAGVLRLVAGGAS